MSKKKPFNLKSGKTEDKEFMRCPQTQCSYYTQGGCKTCDNCKTEPYIIKKSCDFCHSCMSLPGFLRFKNDKNKQKEEELKRLKETLMLAIEQIKRDKEWRQMPVKQDIKLKELLKTI